MEKTDIIIEKISNEETDNNATQKNENKLTLTVEEMGKQLNISRATAYNLARQKDFYPSLRIGHRLLISAEALKHWLFDQTEGVIS